MFFYPYLLSSTSLLCANVVSSPCLSILDCPIGFLERLFIKTLYIHELDCCQIIILSIYVPSTHAYTHVLRLSIDLPNEKR